MNRLSIDPRPPINQGIDTNNATVVWHTAIYNGALSTITEGMQTVGLMVNPYGTAPLSGYLGIWSPTSNPIRVQLANDIGAIPVDYSYTPEPGANLVPLLGLVPAALNHLTVTIPGVGSATAEIITGALPPTDVYVPVDPDAPNSPRFSGFPICEVTIPAVNPPETIEELYFVAFARRFNVGLDHNSTVRWYTTLDIPAMTFERLANGHFLSASDDFDNYRMLYEFDMIGRVHRVYVLDNRAHHSIYQLPDGNIMLPSENTGTSVEDGVSIIDINTGLELAYYDMRNVLDTARPPIPSTPEEIDWLHINQATPNATNNLILVSARHQGVFAVNADTSDLVFILANHQNWGESYQPYLLTPVDDTGAPLYDLTDPDDIDRADKEFWNWGQHAIFDMANETVGIVEFYLLDNGNFRSRDEANALLPINNYSRMVRYRVDLNQMTVSKLYEYGKTEVGSRGYSAFVCNSQDLDNGNFFINFGGTIVDENGRQLTQEPGLSDIVDPLDGETAMGIVIIQEVDPATSTPLLEITCNSGRFKTPEEAGDWYRVDLYSFRARKLSMIP